MSSPVRVPEDVHEEVSRLAAMKNVRPGDLLAEAWGEFLENHRQELASDLEQMAQIIRNGTTEEMTNFVSRGVKERAAQAAKEARGN